MSSPFVPPSVLPRERLDALIEALDEHESPDGGHTIFRAVDYDVASTLESRELLPGDHPGVGLVGLTAEENWWAIGVTASGRAHHMNDDMTLSGDEPCRMRMSYLLARTGDEASILHMNGETHRNPGPAVGKISDLCRRVFGLPTDPPPTGPEMLWTLMWLYRILAQWNQPERRRDLLGSWWSIASLHPAFDEVGGAASGGDRPDVMAAGRALAERFAWSDLVGEARPVDLPWPSYMMPDDTRWFDDGSYARWVLSAYPPVNELSADLHGLLGDLQGDRLIHCARRLLDSVSGIEA